MAHLARLGRNKRIQKRINRDRYSPKTGRKIKAVELPPADDGCESEDNVRNYKVLRKLGRGATGEVMLVRNIETKELLAQKIVPMNSDDEKNRALYAELNTLKDADSPYILGLEKYFRQGFKMYVFLEFMDCGSLRDVINNAIEQKKKIPECLIAQIAHMSLLGLKYLHEEMEVLHRDIKPGNVLLNCEGEVKLADLGMAGNKKVVNNTYLGTMIYMSPERFNGETHGCNCDIWSLGLTLAECALLNFPFTVDVQDPWAVFSVLNNFRKERNLLNKEEYSEEFRDFIDKMLTIEKENRPEAKTLLDHAFLKNSLKKEDEEGPKLGDWLTQLKKDKEKGEK